MSRPVIKVTPPPLMLRISDDIGVINGLRTIAAIRIPDAQGWLPERHIVVCKQRGDTFATYLACRQGTEWVLNWGHYDKTLDQALDDMLTRAKDYWSDGIIS